MKLSECLLDRDVQDLVKMTQRYKCDGERHSKLNLVQSLLYQMMNRQFCYELLSQMDEEKLRFTTFIFFQPKTSFSFDELVSKAKTIRNLCHNKKTSAKDWIAHLLQQGWLYKIAHPLHTQVVIPDDLHALIKQQLINYWRNKCAPISSFQHSMTIWDESELFLADLQTLLHFAHKHIVLLRYEGAMYKRFQLRLMKECRVQEALLTGQKWRFGYGRRFPYYPDRLALMYDYSFHKGWIKEEQNRLYVTPQGVHVCTYFNDERQNRLADCVKFWLKTYSKPVPTVAFLVQWIKECFLDQWIEIEQLYQLCLPWLQTYYFDNEHHIFNKRILQMLIHLGLVRIAYDVSLSKRYVSWIHRDNV